MRITRAIHVPDSFKVYVDVNELDCGNRRLPYATCIGLVNVKRGTVKVWTPAASKPRGYRDAARAALETVLDDLRSGKVKISE